MALAVSDRLTISCRPLTPELPGDPLFEDLGQFPYADACLRETLRLFPPGAVGLREAARDMVLGGGAPPCVDVCSLCGIDGTLLQGPVMHTCDQPSALHGQTRWGVVIST